MALFIAAGIKNHSAIDIGRALLAKYGSLGALGGMPVAELAKERGLGLAKASKLAAAFELGARVAREQVHSSPLDTPGTHLESFGPANGLICPRNKSWWSPWTPACATRAPPSFR